MQIVLGKLRKEVNHMLSEKSLDQRNKVELVEEKNLNTYDTAGNRVLLYVCCEVLSLN